MAEVLPAGWTRRRIDALADACLGKMLDRAKNRGESQPYLRNINVRWFEFDLADVLEMRFEEHEADRYGVLPGDVMVCEGGEPGRAAVWREPTPIRFQKAIHRIRCGAELDPDFLTYQLRHHADSGALAERFTGSTIKHLTGRALKAHEIVVPPIDEQRRIVLRLDELLGRARRARETLCDVPVLLEQLRQSVLDAAFRGDLTAAWREAHPGIEPASAVLERIRAERRHRLEQTHPRNEYVPPDPVDPEAEDLPDLPVGWEWARVAEVAEVTGGLTRNASRRAKSPATVPLVSVAAVQYRRIDREAIGEIGLLDSDGDRAILASGDLLVVEGNGSLDHIGRVALWDIDVPEARHQNHIIRVRARDVTPEYLLEWLCSPIGRAVIVKQATTAAGLYTLSLSKIENLVVPLCSRREQDAVVGALRGLHPAEQRMVDAHARLRHDLDRLEQSLLAKAFRGELH